MLEPLEKLRMPDFHFNDVENERLQTAIMSFQRDVQPAAALPARTAKRDYTVRGRALVRRQNCVGCHEIEGDGGDYRTVVSDPTLAPPMLTPEGREGSARLAVRVLPGAHHDTAVAERPDADVRSG